MYILYSSLTKCFTWFICKFYRYLHLTDENKGQKEKSDLHKVTTSKWLHIFNGFRFRYCQDIDETPMKDMGVPGHLRCRGGDKVGNAKECQGPWFSYIFFW